MKQGLRSIRQWKECVRKMKRLHFCSPEVRGKLRGQKGPRCFFAPIIKRSFLSSHVRVCLSFILIFDTSGGVRKFSYLSHHCFAICSLLRKTSPSSLENQSVHLRLPWKTVIEQTSVTTICSSCFILQYSHFQNCHFKENLQV